MPVKKMMLCVEASFFFALFCGKLLKLFFYFCLLYSEIVSEDKRMNGCGCMDVKEKR